LGGGKSMLNQQEKNRIYAKVKEIIADNLHINEDAVYEGFQFNKFIDNLATYRIQKSGNHHLLYYLEAVNIYFDLSEEFKIEFPISLMDKNAMTVQELVQYIQSHDSSVSA
jgi:acyl carrier protein